MLTFSKLWQEDGGRLGDKTALSCDTDTGPDVVSADDSLGDSRASEDRDGSGSGLLELVLKDDEPEELKIRLGSLSAHVNSRTVRHCTACHPREVDTHRFIR